MAKKKKTIEVQGLIIRIEQIDNSDYVNLTDIAKQADAIRGTSNNSRASIIIGSWLKNSNTLEFIYEWEILHNKYFKGNQMDAFRLDAQKNGVIVSPQRLIQETNAIGLESRSGRYGGTWSHSDIALNFMYWISPKFQVWFIKEFQKLKRVEAKLLEKDWSVKRLITKANHPIFTESVKTHLIDERIPKNKRGVIYASEADLLNAAVFNFSHAEWKALYPNKKGNQRDHADTIDLLIISNLQILDAALMEWGCDQQERLEILKRKAKEQREILAKSSAMKKLK